MSSTIEHVVVGPDAGLLDWLASHGVDYELVEHPLTFTARETARVEGIDPRTFAKTLGVKSPDGRRFLLVLDASDRLDLHKAATALGVNAVRLLTESELVELAPGREVGTMAPIGELYGVPAIADHALREDRRISFHAGSHRYVVRVDRAAWAREAAISYADLAESPSVPEWTL